MDIKASLLAAVRHMLIPIARILIRHGVAYGDFEEAARHAFVKGADSVLRQRRIAVTLARLSVVTGLTRREVDRVMISPAQFALSTPSDWIAAAHVLTAWHTQPPFVLAPVGVPMDLEYEASDSRTTFVELVRTHVPTADPSLVLAILVTAGAVKQDERGLLHPTTRTFVAGELSEIQVRYVARTVRRFLDTLDINLSAEGRTQGRFERSVTADTGVPIRMYGQFVAHIRSTMQKTLEQIDEWITDKASPEAGEPVLWTGVGMYHWLEQPEDLDVAFRELLPDDAQVFDDGSSNSKRQ